MIRTSRIGGIKINALIFASVAMFGDDAVISPRTRVIAVLRERQLFLGNEGDFARYPLFTQPIPRLLPLAPPAMEICNENPFIDVGEIRITSLSTSAVFQTGSTRIIDCETRIKQFRQLLPQPFLPRPSAPDLPSAAAPKSPESSVQSR